MKHRILDAAIAAERAEWLDLWEGWSGREVFAHPAYVSLFARPCDRAVCAGGEDDGGTVLFPLVLRPLAAEPWATPGEARVPASMKMPRVGTYSWSRLSSTRPAMPSAST